MNCRYVARPFAVIGARSSRYIFAFFLAASRSREQIRKLPISHPILTSSPGTAALQNCESSASRLADRVAYRGAFSRVERSSHVLRTHPRNDYQSLRWPSSFTQRVYECSKKKELLYCYTQQYCCNSPRVLGAHWIHTLGHLESTNLPASVAAKSVSNCS